MDIYIICFLELLLVTKLDSMLLIRPFLQSTQKPPFVWTTRRGPQLPWTPRRQTRPQTPRTTLPTPPSTTEEIIIDVPNNEYNYDEVLYKSILFFEAQRSGKLPPTMQLDWRGDSAMYDRGIFGEDLTGGWYDAGDHVKFGFPMASATTALIWGFIEWRESYISAGLEADMLACIKWPLDYFMKAHPSKYEFYAQVGDPYVDHTYWTRPEDMQMFRPAYRLSPESPGSDIAGETAAALAAGAIAFNKTDPRYALLLLSHAIDLYEFADLFRGKYSDTLSIVSEFYPSSSYRDELAWGAIWLYKASGISSYLTQAEQYYDGGMPWSFSWDEKNPGIMILLYKTTLNPRYKMDVEKYIRSWLPGGSVPYTPKGLAFRMPWGALRYSANMAMIALVAADAGLHPYLYRKWAKKQLHYMLGDTGRSYVIGFGVNPPTKPHHTGSSCNPSPWPCSWDDYESPGPNPHILYGALVGGPDINDYYVDDRGDYIQNEVTCDYNAGFHSAIAGLKYAKLRGFI